MRIFILIDTPWVASPSLVYQNILSILEASVELDQAHFYLVGNEIASEYLIAYQELSKKASFPLEFITKQEAIQLMPSITNAVVVHFGASLKGSDRFAHYFIPLGHPRCFQLTAFKKWIQHRKFNKYLQQSTASFCINEWVLSDLTIWEKQSNLIQTAYLPLPSLVDYDWLSNEKTKEAIAGGNPFFIAFVDVDEVVATLKEFSIFKKWQQTAMSLVLILKNEQMVDQAKQIIKGYKFKEAVFIYPMSLVETHWFAATYAILWSSVHFEVSNWVQWAIKYNIPLLFNTNIQTPSTWAQAGDVFDFTAPMALSNHFKLYYKDEVYRQARANMGNAWLNQLQADASTKLPVKIPACFKS
jgi:hypothetical protein